MAVALKDNPLHPQIALRSPDIVMKLGRMGSFSQRA